MDQIVWDLGFLLLFTLSFHFSSEHGRGPHCVQIKPPAGDRETEDLVGRVRELLPSPTMLRANCPQHLGLRTDRIDIVTVLIKYLLQSNFLSKFVIPHLCFICVEINMQK